VIGTFSSIFVASPVLYAIEQRWPHTPSKSSGPGRAGGQRRQTAVV
jgi:hypothetical protein